MSIHLLVLWNRSHPGGFLQSVLLLCFDDSAVFLWRAVTSLAANGTRVHRDAAAGLTDAEQQECGPICLSFPGLTDWLTDCEV